MEENNEDNISSSKRVSPYSSYYLNDSPNNTNNSNNSINTKNNSYVPNNLNSNTHIPEIKEKKPTKEEDNKKYTALRNKYLILAKKHSYILSDNGRRKANELFVMKILLFVSYSIYAFTTIRKDPNALNMRSRKGMIFIGSFFALGLVNGYYSVKLYQRSFEEQFRGMTVDAIEKQLNLYESYNL